MNILEKISREILSETVKGHALLESKTSQSLQKFIKEEATYEQVLNMTFNPEFKTTYLSSDLLEAAVWYSICEQLSKEGLGSHPDMWFPKVGTVSEKMDYLGMLLNEGVGVAQKTATGLGQLAKAGMGAGIKKAGMLQKGIGAAKDLGGKIVGNPMIQKGIGAAKGAAQWLGSKGSQFGQRVGQAVGKLKTAAQPYINKGLSAGSKLFQGAAGKLTNAAGKIGGKLRDIGTQLGTKALGGGFAIG